MRILGTLRAIVTWVLKLTSGFAAFMLLATLVLLPIQAAKNRALIASVDRHAHRLAEAQNWPRNSKLGEGFTKTPEGVWVWPSLPGSCHDISFEAPSDRFSIGFWDNGNGGRFGSTWWHCYAYPSRNTTLQLSVADYLGSAAGQQMVDYALIAAITGGLAFLLRPRRHFQDLRPWPKAIWFGALMTVSNIFYGLLDTGDDQFFTAPEWAKWFAYSYGNTIWLLLEPLAQPIMYLDYSLNIGGHFGGDWQNVFDFSAIFVVWTLMGWTAGRLFVFARHRFGSQ